MADIKQHKQGGGTNALRHISDRITYRENEMTTATATTTRVDANSVSFTEGQDEIEILNDAGATVFRGPLRDVRRQSQKVELLIDSFERYAMEAPPTPAKYVFFDIGDAQVVNDAISRIPDLSAGQVDSIQSGIKIIFHYDTPALMIRLMRRASKAHVRYNPDKTVDYIAPSNYGRDKTGTTLSPSNGNVVSMRPRQQGGEKRKTHLKMIGAGGVAVNVVSSSYTDDRRERWGRALFRNVGSETVLQIYGDALLSELDTEWLEVEAKLTAVSDVQVGDTYTVDYPEQGIDSETLTVAELTESRDNTGLHYDATLSNRTFARNRKANERKRQTSQNSRVQQTSVGPNMVYPIIPTVKVPAGQFVVQRLWVPDGYKLLLYAFGFTVDEPPFKPAQRDNLLAQLLESPDGSVVYEQTNNDPFHQEVPIAVIDDGPKTPAFALRNNRNSAHWMSLFGNWSLEPKGGI